MADTAIAITAGAGTNIDTRTEATNGNHRQVVVLGDPSTNAGVAPVDATNGLAVQVIPALPAGTNAIGKLAANSGVDIGDVDVTSVVPGAGATNLGKAEDAAHTTGDIGVAVLSKRTDAAASSAGTDGDYATINTDASGRVWANVDQVTPGTTATSLGKAADAVHTTGDVGVMALAVRKDTAGALAGTDGDYIPLTTDSNGLLRVSIDSDNAGSTIDTDDGTVAAGQSSVALTIAEPYQYDGSNWTRVRGEHTVAHDAVDAGNPAKLGAKAKSALSGITLVASDDRTDLYADLDGVLLARPASLGDVVQERTTNIDGASTAFASGLAAPGVGLRLWITQVTVCNSSATFGTVDLRDGAAGSVLWTLPVPATGGVVQQFNPPLKLTANTALAFDASAAITTITISANGFKSKL